MHFKVILILMYLSSSSLFSASLTERLIAASKKTQKLRTQMVINQIPNTAACATKCKVKCHQCKGSPSSNY